MSKITRATLKSFIKNNKNLFINVRAAFNGQNDGLDWYRNKFEPIEYENKFDDHTLGIKGAWLVGQSRDYFTAYNDDEFSGIEVYNCCGKFILAVQK
jgi:hypothetical protein